MDKSIFGKNIKKIRQMKGLRQEDLAELVDCGNSHIGQIENGRGCPRLELAVKIANALEVTLDELLKENYVKPEMVYLKEISERIEKFPVQQRIKACEGLLGYLDSLEKFSQ